LFRRYNWGMTLAVAARFPWLDYKSWLPKSIRKVHATFPWAQPEPALLFAADSRWTYRYRTGSKYADGAVKVAEIDQRGAAVYAGNANAGELALAKLRQWMSQARAGEETPDLRDGIRDTWLQFAHQGGGLHILFGFFDGFDVPHLFHLSDADDFLPHAIDEPESIGPNAATLFFKEQLHNSIVAHSSRPRSSRVISQHPDGWLSIFETIIWDVGRRGLDPSVGGPPLGLLVTPSGLRGCQITILDPETGAVAGSSLSQDEVRRFYQDPMRKGQRDRISWFFRAPSSRC
jgi:hypothetical protein